MRMVNTEFNQDLSNHSHVSGIKRETTVNVSVAKITSKFTEKKKNVHPTTICYHRFGKKCLDFPRG